MKTSFPDYRSYGFEYEMDGKSFSFVVVAPSLEDAKAKFAAMRDAQYVGELHRAESAIA